MEKECSKCGNKNLWKNGFVKGKQRWKCTHCKHQFILEKAERGKPEWLKLLAILLYSMKKSIRSIARLVKVSPKTILDWIREFKIPDNQENLKSEIVELDEMWHYLSKKNSNCGYGKHMILLESDLLDGNVGIVLPKH